MVYPSVTIAMQTVIIFTFVIAIVALEFAIRNYYVTLLLLTPTPASCWSFPTTTTAIPKSVSCWSAGSGPYIVGPATTLVVIALIVAIIMLLKSKKQTASKVKSDKNNPVFN